MGTISIGIKIDGKEEFLTFYAREKDIIKLREVMLSPSPLMPDSLQFVLPNAVEAEEWRKENFIEKKCP